MTAINDKTKKLLIQHLNETERWKTWTRTFDEQRAFEQNIKKMQEQTRTDKGSER